MHYLSLFSTSLIVSVALASLLKLLKSVYGRLTDTIKDLPGPPSPSWVYGHFKEIAREGHGYIQERWAKDYGKTFVYWEIQTRVLYTLDLKAVRHITAHSEIYQKSEPTRWLLSRLSGNGLLTSEGDPHKQQRRVTNPAFGVAQIRELTEIFVTKSNQLRDILLTECQKSNKPINMSTFLSKATLDIIGLAGFNRDFEALNETGKPNELNEIFASFFGNLSQGQLLTSLQAFFPPLRIFRNPQNIKAKHAKETINKLGRDLIQEAKDSIKEHEELKEKGNWKNKDIFSLLVRANVAEDLSEGMRMSENDVLSQIPTFIVAGHETTSTATTWALFALSNYPKVQSRLRKELLAFESDTPSMDDLNSLPYLDHVLREVLRFHSPVPVAINRIAVTDDVIPLSQPVIDKRGKVHEHLSIKKGQSVHVPILGINRDEDLWGQDAKEFNPDRWDSLPDAVSAIPGPWGNQMTFFAGNRTCIGFRFSLVETKALLFALLRSFEFEMGIDSKRITSTVGIVQRPCVIGDLEGGTQMPLIVRPYISD